MNTERIFRFLLGIIESLVNIIKNISKIDTNTEEFPQQEHDNIQDVLDQIIDNDFHDEEFIYFILGRLY